MKDTRMNNESPRLLIADSKGKIFAHPDLEPAGMKADQFFRLDPADLVKLPAGSQLFKLPDRRPVGYDGRSGRFVNISDAFAIAAFAAPGHTLTHNSAYNEDAGAKPLPLFAYGAAALYKGETYVTALMVDEDRRHDTTLIDIDEVKKNIPKFKKLFPNNRLIEHLAGCALINGCPNAQNFFLSRYEAPLPASPSCNASCAGCISYQEGDIPCSQPRIKFVPTPNEIAGIALSHIARVKNSIVSFGQGCEGEPLLQSKLAEESIRIIRKNTDEGTINLNTNGSKPTELAKLFEAGLDTVRISLNSARENYYNEYYRPQGYSFKDVVKSLKMAKKKGGFVSINYLTMPGFTDSYDEIRAFAELIKESGVDMIQWRNLNYDPLYYFRILSRHCEEARSADEAIPLFGIAQEISSLKRLFPKLKMGYFNPTILRPQSGRRI